MSLLFRFVPSVNDSFNFDKLIPFFEIAHHLRHHLQDFFLDSHTRRVVYHISSTSIADTLWERHSLHPASRSPRATLTVSNEEEWLQWSAAGLSHIPSLMLKGPTKYLKKSLWETDVYRRGPNYFLAQGLAVRLWVSKGLFAWICPLQTLGLSFSHSFVVDCVLAKSGGGKPVEKLRLRTRSPGYAA